MAIADIIESLRGGNVLVRRGTSLPETVKVEGQLALGEWNLVARLSPAELDKELYKAGWQFFYIPPETQAGALGFNRKQALARALKKLLAKADAAKLNAVHLPVLKKKSSWVFTTRALAHISVTFRRV